MKKVLNDKTIGALKSAPEGQRYIAKDVVVPGFGVRVTDTGHKTYVVGGRVGGKPFKRFKLGAVGAITLAAARDKARLWLADIKMGIDPVLKEKRAAAEEKENRFEQAAEDFIRIKLKGKRSARVVSRDIRREIIAPWRDKKITEIARRDVVRLIEGVAARSPTGAAAHNTFAHVRNIFNFVIARSEIIEHSPCDRLKPSKLIGERATRQRVLEDDELRAVWRGSLRTSEPYSSIVRALLLTGCRREEVTGARRRELDLGPAQVWTIPESRYKTKRPHVIPLTPGLLTLLDARPRFNRSDLLFSVDGENPFNDFSRAKRLLDKRVLRAWRALGRVRGIDRRHVDMERWTLHDLRRTVRTRLSELRVPEVVAELVIGHARRGMGGVYDQYQFSAEKREVLLAWQAHLRTIVDPPSAPPSEKVVALDNRRRA